MSSFGHAEAEMSIRSPSGGDTSVAGYPSLEFQGEVQARTYNWESSPYRQYLKP